MPFAYLTATDRLIADLGQRAGEQARRLQDHQQRHQQHALAGFASISLGGSPRRSSAQPICDVAYNPEEIKARLSGVPVYTVANKQNEFILVAGESGDQVKQLGLIFMSEDDANALIEKVREQNPKLAKQSRVLKVSMDNVYDFAVTPEVDKKTAGVSFRFMPDLKQVQKALELYKEAGVPGRTFTGVPVFQAQGLTVKTENSRYTPLFLAKEDLDVAVGAAFSQREAAKEVANKSKASAAEEEVASARATLEGASKGKQRKAAQAELDRAEARLAKYQHRISTGQHGDGLPKVEVGCLEEVLSRMAVDQDGSWGSVMFIPKGALSQQR
ncbi:g10006 [Coccomyxa viridis]|uniref:G10006 protein n=1 Tax=Coccomyxa viridis TaxID=1274662 RepID=A0ABP1G701_9CHLO